MAARKKGPAAKKPVKKKPAARKKTAAGASKPRQRKRTPDLMGELKKNLFGILVLVSICLTVAMVADIFIRPKLEEPPPPRPEPIVQKEKSQRVPNKTALPKKPGKAARPQNEPLVETSASSPITYEVFKDVKPVIKDKAKERIKSDIPKIAIIIDDIGYDRKAAMDLVALHPDITFSVLPFSPFGRQLSKALHAKGAQLMLHLPMEPVEYPRVNPGPGAILSRMSPDALIDQLEKDLFDVPHAVGVNNHMGSKLTASADQMNQIFTILKKNDLFFIDSRTAPRSQGRASARLLKLKFAQRDVFLDNFQDGAYITGQFEELVKMARRHGSAIGIGHPYRVTVETLEKLLPKIKGKVKIVRASELTRIPG